MGWQLWEAGFEASGKTDDGQVEAPLQTETGPEVVNSLSEGLEDRPMWLDLHSVQRDKGFERVQGTMHVPGAWPQDWGAPCLFHVLSKGKGSGVPAVLLPVLPCCRLQRLWEGRSDPPEAVARVL